MANLDLIIRNAEAIFPDTPKRQDVGVSDGYFAVIQDTISEPAREELSAAGLTLFAGLIDSHVHFNEPGRSSWEGLRTGSAALAAGGGTMFFDMPLNSTPPVLDHASFIAKKQLAEAKSYTDFALWAGLTPDNLDHLSELAEAGAIGFKAFMSASGIADFKAVDDDSLYKGMEQAAKLALPVAVHAEREAITRLAQQTRQAKGGTSVRDYCETRPIEAELEAIRRAIAMAAASGCDLHIVHVSSSAGLALISEAKAQGIRVTAETCPHYVFFNQQDMEQRGAVLKCAPPLRPEAERKALWEALLRGEVDILGSDHSPSSLDLKTAADFFAVWGGVAGVQSSLGAMLQLGLALPQLSRLFSARPAERFGLAAKGKIAVGYEADFCLLDVNASYQLEPAELLTRHPFSPYLGRELQGRVQHTFLRGQHIMQQGKVIGKASGTFRRPDRSAT